MFRTILLCLLSAGTVMAQAKPAAKPKAPGAKTPAKTQSAAPAQNEASLPPAAPVLTLHGLCAVKTAGKPCTTTVSKAQFDNLVDALNPTSQAVPPDARRRLATFYVELLAWSEAAKKAGEEKNPKLAELLRVQRLKIMADLYRLQLQKQYQTPPASEVEAYYKQHKDTFVSANLRRLYIPKSNPTAKASDEEKKAFEAKARQLSDQMRDRAAKGEDMDTLQKEAYKDLGLTMTPPNTQIGPVRKGALPAELDKEIFSLSPGGVYKSDEPTGYVIYKLENKETLPEDKVKEEISRDIFRQKFDEKSKEITSAVQADFNEKYFGPATPTPPSSSPQMPGKPAAPPPARR